MPSNTQPSMDYLRFSRQVDLCLRGELSKHEALLVKEHTPVVLQRYGLPNLRILYTQKHLRAAVLPKSATNDNAHGLSVDLVKKIPDLLESPAVILHSATQVDSYVYSLVAADQDGLPIIAAIRKQGIGTYAGRREKSNFMLSVYGKDNFGVTGRIMCFYLGFLSGISR